MAEIDRGGSRSPPPCLASLSDVMSIRVKLPWNHPLTPGVDPQCWLQVAPAHAAPPEELARARRALSSHIQGVPSQFAPLWTQIWPLRRGQFKNPSPVFKLKKIPFRAGLLDGNKKLKSKNFEIFVKTLKFHYYLVNILLHINVKLIKVVVVQYL